MVRSIRSTHDNDGSERVGRSLGPGAFWLLLLLSVVAGAALA